MPKIRGKLTPKEYAALVETHKAAISAAVEAALVEAIRKMTDDLISSTLFGSPKPSGLDRFEPRITSVMAKNVPLGCLMCCPGHSEWHEVTGRSVEHHDTVLSTIHGSISRVPSEERIRIRKELPRKFHMGGVVNCVP